MPAQTTQPPSRVQQTRVPSDSPWHPRNRRQSGPQTLNEALNPQRGRTIATATAAPLVAGAAARGGGRTLLDRLRSRYVYRAAPSPHLNLPAPTGVQGAVNTVARLHPRQYAVRGLKGGLQYTAAQEARNLTQNLKEHVGDVQQIPLARAAAGTLVAGLRGGLQDEQGFGTPERILTDRAIAALASPDAGRDAGWMRRALDTISPVRIPRNAATQYVRGHVSDRLNARAQQGSQELIDYFHAQRALPPEAQNWDAVLRNPGLSAAFGHATTTGAADFAAAGQDLATTNRVSRQMWDYNAPRLQAVTEATQDSTGGDAARAAITELARQYPAQAGALTGRVIAGSRDRAEDAAERQALSMISRVTGVPEDEIMRRRQAVGQAATAAGVATDLYQNRNDVANRAQQVQSQAQQFMQSDNRAQHVLDELRERGQSQVADTVQDFIERYFTVPGASPGDAPRR